MELAIVAIAVWAVAAGLYLYELRRAYPCTCGKDLCQCSQQ